MADEALRLNAVVVDQFTKPLQNLKNQLSNVTQAPALANMRKDWGNLTKEITGGARALQSSFLPALSGINVASLGVAGAITGMVAAMKGMSEGAVQGGIFRRSIDLTGQKFKEMKLLGEALGQSSEQTKAGLQGLYRTIDELRNTYGQSFQRLAGMRFGTQAMALGAAKSMTEAIDMAIAMIRAEPNKERQRDFARAIGWEGLDVIAREGSEELLKIVREIAQKTSGLSEEAALKFNLNMLRMKVSAENLTQRALAPMIPVINQIMDAVEPKVETLFTQLANDIPKVFKGLEDLGKLWSQGKYYEMFSVIERGTKMDLSVSKDSRAGALEKRLEILKERRGTAGSEGDVYEEKQLRKEIDELRGGRQPAPGAATGPQKEIADRQRRLEEIRELRTGPVATSLQSDLEKEEIKLREEIKKLRESIEHGATIQQQGLQGGGVGGGGLIQPAALGGGGGFGAGRSFGGGRFGGLGGGEGGDGGGFGGVPGPSVPSIGGALGGPKLSGQSGIGPALGANDPVAGAGGGASGGKGWWTPDRLNFGVNYLMKNAGLSKVAAQGLISRFAGIEAPGGPGQRGGYMGRASGIGQWLGPRLRAGVPMGDYEGQLAKVVRELKGDPREGTNEGRAYRSLLAARTPHEAASAAEDYERATSPRVSRSSLVNNTVRAMHRFFGGAGGGGTPSVPSAGGGGLGAGGIPDHIKAFIAHHAASDPATGKRIDTPGELQKVLAARGLSAGVNWFMDREGNVTPLRPPGSTLAHVRPDKGAGARLGLSNKNTLGMEIAASNDRDINAKQVEAFRKFWAGIKAQRPDLPIFGHGEIQRNKQSDEGLTIARMARGMPPGDLLRAGAASQAPGSLEAKGTVNIHLHDSMKDKNAKVNMDGMFQKVNVNRGRSMPTPDAPPI